MRGGNASYNERPFTDLVDEEKRPFVKRRVLSTLLGGYRIAFDDGDEESSIPIHLHIFQIFIYAIMPAIVIVMTRLPIDRPTAVIIGGAVPMVINLVI